MLSRSRDCDSCRKSAVVLTCFVNGRKHFVAAPIFADADPKERIEPSPAHASRRASRKAWTVDASPRRSG
jgi:hypothetical protein